MRKIFEQVISFFKRHRQIINFVICLCVSFFLWLFITYGRDYQHSTAYTLKFTNNEHNVEYFTQDSIITVGIKTNGFEYLFRSSKHDKKDLIIDVDKINLNLSNGKANLPSSALKSQIMHSLGYRGADITLSPSTVRLKWNKIYSKRVKIVNKCVFKCQKPYDMYSDAVIEGTESLLEKIDSVNTKNVTYKNINKSGIFIVPLDLDLPNGATCRMTNVPVKINAEKYTENIAMLPVKAVRYEDGRNIKVLPKQVKVRYRVAVKDFAKINEKEFNAFVVCSDEAMSKSNKLKVNLSNIPDYVKIVNIYPQKVEYILFK